MLRLKSIRVSKTGPGYFFLLFTMRRVPVDVDDITYNAMVNEHSITDDEIFLVESLMWGCTQRLIFSIVFYIREIGSLIVICLVD